MIRYANGSKDIFAPISTKTDPKSVQNQPPRVDTDKKMYIWVPKVEKYNSTNAQGKVALNIQKFVDKAAKKICILIFNCIIADIFQLI